ncbi:MAG: hypothetical protein QOD29_1468 [Alphaproteobacteria bacterium]|jgi:hypothetical protein|nr:hypothetical protein [Alphaproteobacteria bacterium]
MQRVVIICFALLLVAALAPEASAWRGGGGVAVRGPAGGVAVRGPYGGGAARGPGGAAAVRGPAGAAAVRGPAGNVAVRGPTTTVYGGAYGYRAPVAAGVVAGAAVVGAAAAAKSYPPYYTRPCGPPYTPSCP